MYCIKCSQHITKLLVFMTGSKINLACLIQSEFTHTFYFFVVSYKWALWYELTYIVLIGSQYYVAYVFIIARELYMNLLLLEKWVVMFTSWSEVLNKNMTHSFFACLKIKVYHENLISFLWALHFSGLTNSYSTINAI